MLTAVQRHLLRYRIRITHSLYKLKGQGFKSQ